MGISLWALGNWESGNCTRHSVAFRGQNQRSYTQAVTHIDHTANPQSICDRRNTKSNRLSGAAFSEAALVIHAMVGYRAVSAA